MDSIKEAVEQFTAAWSDLAGSMILDYDCTLTCSEAETLANLFRVVGQDQRADDVIRLHAEHDDDPDDLHYAGEQGERS